MLPLPVDANEITAEWLQQALATRFPGVRVRAAKIGAPIQGTASKFRVHLDYTSATAAGAANTAASNAPKQLIVKGGFSAHRELMYYIYKLEAQFYRDLAPQLEVRVPECYFSGYDDTRKQGIVLLEDLDARGATFCWVQKPLTYDQAAAQLDALARLHARWWNDSRSGLLGWIEPLDPLPEGEAGAYQRGQLKPEVYAHYMALPRGVAVPSVFHDRDRMERAMEALRAVDRTGPHCVLHSDSHLGNLYFDHDGAAGLVDWQSVRTGPWAHDVCYQLVSSLDMLDRRRWEEPLLKHYLARLGAYGVAAPSYASALDDYRRQIVYGLYYWLVNPVEFQVEVNNCAVAPRFAWAAIDHGCFELLGV